MVEFPRTDWKDYALLDSGNGLKLERFGKFAAIRPEPKALWTPSMSDSDWNRIAAVRFKPGAGFGKAGKEDAGTWERLKEMPDQWWVRYPGTGFNLNMRLGLTSFKHVGIFPEQAPNWEFIHSKVRTSEGSAPFDRLAALDPTADAVPPPGAPGKSRTFWGGFTLPREALVSGGTPSAAPKVLNLFAYTGGASLAARSAGADVTHLDSVRQVVSWARENMEASGLTDIRWVVEDAMKFARREAKRGHLYDGIILDPPAYGHGPDGEKWKLDELLFDMLRTVRQILAPHGWMVLNLYSNGYSAALGETVVREAFGLKAVPVGDTPGAGTPAGDAGDTPIAGTPAGDAAAASPENLERGSYRLTSGELALNDKFGKALPLSIYVRLEL